MRLIISILILLLLIAPASAELITITSAKETYFDGETVQLEITTKNPEQEPKASNLKFLNQENEIIKVAPIFTKLEENNYYA